MKKLVVANWKMNPVTLKGAKFLFNSVKRGVRNIKNVEVVICPPFIYLSELRIKNKELGIKLGAQDSFWEKGGAFTGEVSPLMIEDVGCQYVILGHSERRKYFNETDEMINKKIKAVLDAQLKPILCIGETEEERKKNRTEKILKAQLQKDLKNIENRKFKTKDLILAYEPVWAIGTGNPCHFKEAKKVLSFLRKFLKGNKILYGGSVNSQNAKPYIQEAGFQGLLVGGSSLDAKDFLKIIKDLDS